MKICTCSYDDNMHDAHCAINGYVESDPLLPDTRKTCICVDNNPITCKAERYGYAVGEYHGDPCRCSCHDDFDDAEAVEHGVQSDLPLAGGKDGPVLIQRVHGNSFRIIDPSSR